MGTSLNSLLAAIVEDDQGRVKELLKADPDLHAQRIERARLYDSGIFHWLYVADTPLHLAAAGHRVEIVNLLLAAGADVNAAANHRRSSPLHYAADGFITGLAWDENRQVQAICPLIAAGAALNAQDKNGATPLHRAVRTRSAAAVECLLNAGGNPTLRNKSGSMAIHLAVQTTGRGGSGTDVARAAQRRIIESLLSCGISTSLKDGKGRSVLQCATSEGVKALITARDLSIKGSR